jgi:hypothetical protein
MNIYRLALPLVVAFIAGCGGSSGSGFEGKWRQNVEKNTASMVIRKDGEIFHIDYKTYNPWLKNYGTKKLEASVVSDSVLTIVGSMGVANLRLEGGHIFFDNREYLKSD